MLKNVLPAVVLVVLIALGVMAAGERYQRWARREQPGAAVALPPSVAPPPASTRGPGAVPAPASLEIPVLTVGTSRELECLVDPHGIRRKVLVIRPGVRASRTSSGGEFVGVPLRYFWPLFVFEVDPPTGEPMSYRVGSSPAARDIVGWLPAADVVPWNTRVGARHVRSGGRSMPMLVHADRAELIQQIETGREARAIARSPRVGGWKPMPWPILEVAHHEFAGRAHELCKLAFVGENRSGAASPGAATREVPTTGRAYSDAEVQAMVDDLETLEVVFCVDNTVSTQPYLEAIRATVGDTATRLRTKADASKVRLRLGLVLYRDHVPAIMFPEKDGPSPVRVFPLESDLDAFVDRARELGVAPFDSVDEPEAVYDGVDAALGRSGWAGGVLSKRVIILVGDDAAHEPGHPRNPKGISGSALIETARGMKPPVTIEALCFDANNTPQARQEHWRQFSALADGTGGKCRSNDDTRELVASLESLLVRHGRVVENRAHVTRAVRSGKSVEETARALDMDIHEVTEVLEFLEGAGVDLRGLAPGVPAFTTGWCLADVSGEPVLEKYVYVLRSELMLLNAELSRLAVYLEPRQVGEVLDVSAWGRVDPGTFFAQKGATVMNQHLLARGIPCRKGGLLQVSRDDLDHLSEEARGALRKRIGEYHIPQIIAAINDTRHFAESEPLEPGWVPEAILP